MIGALWDALATEVRPLGLMARFILWPVYGDLRLHPVGNANGLKLKKVISLQIQLNSSWQWFRLDIVIVSVPVYFSSSQNVTNKTRKLTQFTKFRSRERASYGHLCMECRMGHPLYDCHLLPLRLSTVRSKAFKHVKWAGGFFKHFIKVISREQTFSWSNHNFILKEYIYINYIQYNFISRFAIMLNAFLHTR